MSFDQPFDAAAPVRVCFVCSGNICRSPMAEAVLRRVVEESGLGSVVSVTSAGTGDWHVGERADDRTLAALEGRGYDASEHRARQFDRSWFSELDIVVALDRGHERVLKDWAPTARDRDKVRLLLDFDPASQEPDVPDPYYSDATAFDTALASIERAATALAHSIGRTARQETP